jgi:hypothetical protein
LLLHAFHLQWQADHHSQTMAVGKAHAQLEAWRCTHKDLACFVCDEFSLQSKQVRGTKTACTAFRACCDSGCNNRRLASRRFNEQGQPRFFAAIPARFPSRVLFSGLVHIHLAYDILWKRIASWIFTLRFVFSRRR